MKVISIFVETDDGHRRQSGIYYIRKTGLNDSDIFNSFKLSLDSGQFTIKICNQMTSYYHHHHCSSSSSSSLSNKNWK